MLIYSVLFYAHNFKLLALCGPLALKKLKRKSV